MSPGAQNIRSGQGWRGGWGQPVDPQGFPVAHRMQHVRKQLAGRGHLGDAAPMTLVSDADAAGALAGRWGPVVWQASLAAELDLAIVSAVIVVLDDAHEGLPLLAFAMTDPACQRRGIGRWLIEESMRHRRGSSHADQPDLLPGGDQLDCPGNAGGTSQLYGQTRPAFMTGPRCARHRPRPRRRPAGRGRGRRRIPSAACASPADGP
jgi:GNAT superfamily N-acetyltransferase